MENYFNYFTEIEEHFQRRWGGILRLSPLDWVLMETWRDAGIPLAAVLRGIDVTFEHYERRPSKTRKINGLGFCSQEVLAAVKDLMAQGIYQKILAKWGVQAGALAVPRVNGASS